VLAGHLYAAGGGGTCASVERYNVATNTWTPVADMLKEWRYSSVVCIETDPRGPSRGTGPLRLPHYKGPYTAHVSWWQGPVSILLAIGYM
jgi:hypothetical protein